MTGIVQGCWTEVTGARMVAFVGCACRLKGRARCGGGCTGEAALDHARLWDVPGEGRVVVAHLYGLREWIEWVTRSYAEREGLDVEVGMADGSDPYDWYGVGTVAVLYRVRTAHRLSA